MNSIIQKETIEELKKKILQMRDILSIEKKREQIVELSLQLQQPDAWSDPARAQTQSQTLSSLERHVAEWDALWGDIGALEDLVASGEEDASGEMERMYEDIERRYAALEFYAFFSGPHDQKNAILSIHAGTGGVDAMDWAEKLLRMYARYCEAQGWKTRMVDEHRGTEAGIKSATLEIAGPYAYGHLKSEHGVHRLVRISPFDAEGLRQTSFALCEVVPDLGEDESTVAIDPKDVRIDTFRAGGHGGQGVNTTDSAVRITHLPTGITVTCQNERSQLQNKETAFKLLRGKLSKLAEAEREEERRLIKGASTPAAWGNQIRSYVLNPYRMVKDHRTNAETSDVTAVLDGDLTMFIESYLRQQRH